MEWIKVLAPFVTAILAAWLAARTAMRRWRIEMTGRRKGEVAEEALAAVYRHRDVFAAIRSGVFPREELRERERGENEPDDEFADMLDMEFAMLRRFDRNADLFNQVHLLGYRFRAVFPDDAAPFEMLFAAENEVRAAIRVAVGLLQQRRGNVDALSKVAIISYGDDGTPDDGISLRVAEAVRQLEAACLFALSAEHEPDWLDHTFDWIELRWVSVVAWWRRVAHRSS